MDAQKLIKAVGAVMVSNRAILCVEGENMIIAKAIDNKMVLNENGLALAAELEAAPKQATPKAKKPEAPQE
jgi:hypothetical protein